MNDARVSSLLTRILRAPSPFYRARLRQAGMEEGEGALARVPLTRRDEIVADQIDHPPLGTRRFADAPLPVRAGASGSGGDLLVLAWSREELARERAAGVRLLRRLGVKPEMRVANTLPGALASPGSLLLGDVVEEVGAMDVPFGWTETEAAAKQAWEVADMVQPQVLVLAAPVAECLFAAAPARERPWWKGIVWLRRAGAAASTVAVPEQAGFAGWQRTWLAVAEAASFAGVTCSADRLHVDEAVVAEVLDERTGESVPAGETGVLALTSLEAETPVLRYLSGVEAKATPGPCPCGGDGAVVELVGK